MKIKFLTLSLIAAASFAAMTFTSCKKCDNKTDTIYVYLDTSIKYETLSGALTTQSLDATKRYLIKGTVTVDDGITLTIPAGTKLFGEKSSKGTLVIKKGGKLVAEGTASSPIIFTSAQATGAREQGDWGGIVMLGKANVNQNNPAIEGISPAVNYGTYQSTSNDADNSGVLKYVRIEYAGIALTPNNETNSLTLGGVGSGTTVDYVQVTYGGDDGFEWFGGTVECKHLVSLGTWDDDFDTDFGYSGKVQYALAIRDPFNADQSGSNGFESDNDASGSTSTPKTSAVFSNVTLLGASFDSTKAVSGNYQHAMHLRRNTELSIFNSVLAGFPLGLNLDGTLTNYTSGAGVLDNNILVSIGNNKKSPRPFISGTTDNAAVGTYFTTTKTNKVFTANSPMTGTPAHAKAYADAGIDPSLIMGYNTTAGVTGNYPKNPILTSFSGLTQTGASFTDAKLTNSFFSSTTFIGAFGSTDWTDTWANFNPQNDKY